MNTALSRSEYLGANQRTLRLKEGKRDGEGLGGMSEKREGGRCTADAGEPERWETIKPGLRTPARGGRRGGGLAQRKALVIISFKFDSNVHLMATC